MKLGFIADLHARPKDLDAFTRQYDAAVSVFLKNNVDAVIYLGDIFDKAGLDESGIYGDGAIIRAVGRGIKRLSDAGVEVILIGGDHDVLGAGRTSSIVAFEGIPRVRVATEPMFFALQANSIESIVGYEPPVELLCLPWCWDPSKDATAEVSHLILGSAKSNTTEPRTAILAAHISVSGLLMNAKQVAEPIENASSRARTWQVSRDFLDGLIEGGAVDHIRLGDFHKRHHYYVGALRQLNHGEEGNHQGVEILDTATGETAWFELDEAPRYRTVQIDVGEMVPERAANENLKVRLDCDLDPGEIRRLESAGVTVERIVEREERKARAEIPAGIIDDDNALIRMHYASLGIDEETMRRDIAVFHNVMSGGSGLAEEAAKAEPVAVGAVEELDF